LYAGTENLGIVFSQLYRKNIENISVYKFGDVYSAVCLATYRINNMESTYSFAVGPQFEFQTEAEQSDYILDGTSREIMSAALRADYSRGNFFCVYSSNQSKNNRIRNIAFKVSITDRHKLFNK